MKAYGRKSARTRVRLQERVPACLVLHVLEIPGRQQKVVNVPAEELERLVRDFASQKKDAKELGFETWAKSGNF